LKFKNILIVYNPSSQGGKSVNLFNEYLTIIKKEGSPFTIFETTGINDVENIQEIISSNAFDLISIIGGDGTINITINGLQDFGIPIHIVPAGTGNDLARILYGHLKIIDILRLPFQYTKKVNIDIWSCNQIRFINGFGAGFDGAIAEKTQSKTFLFSSKTKYWIEIIKQILFYRSPKMEINGKKMSIFMIAAANGSDYGGGFKVAPLAKLDDKKLEYIQCNNIPILHRLYYLPLVQAGKHLSQKAITYKQVNELTISSHQPLPAHLDGEPLCEKSYHIKWGNQAQFLR
jgi:YegS/Rv2252/BmrU family lipid kinase